MDHLKSTGFCGGNARARTVDLLRVKYISVLFHSYCSGLLRSKSQFINLQVHHRTQQPLTVTNKLLANIVFLLRRFYRRNKFLNVRMDVNICRCGIVCVPQYLLQNFRWHTFPASPAGVCVPGGMGCLSFNIQTLQKRVIITFSKICDHPLAGVTRN